MSKDNVLDAMRALPQRRAGEAQAPAVTKERVQQEPHGGAVERGATVRENSAPSLHAVFGLGKVHQPRG